MIKEKKLEILLKESKLAKLSNEMTWINVLDSAELSGYQTYVINLLSGKISKKEDLISLMPKPISSLLSLKAKKRMRFFRFLRRYFGIKTFRWRKKQTPPKQGFYR